MLIFSTRSYVNISRVVAANLSYEFKLSMTRIELFIPITSRHVSAILPLAAARLHDVQLSSQCSMPTGSCTHQLSRQYLKLRRLSVDLGQTWTPTSRNRPSHQHRYNTFTSIPRLDVQATNLLQIHTSTCDKLVFVLPSTCNRNITIASQ